MAPHTSANPPAEGDSRGWFKSSYSAAACTCVEVNLDGEQVLVRDSKRGTPPPGSGADGTNDDVVLAVDRAEWAAFLADVRGGRPNRRCRALALAGADDGSTTVICTRSGVSLGFDAAEWRAFSAGVWAGEFSR